MADSLEIDSRMEQIRLNEEKLEKKHKEILEDELIAKNIGATIQKDSTSTSQKTIHRYDNLELDFDVKAEEKEHAKNPDYKPKSK